MWDGNTEEVGLDEVDGALEIREPSGAGAVVCGGDEGFDVGFVVGEEGVDVLLVDGTGALGLWEDEVGEEEEADVGVEREPVGKGIILGRVWGERRGPRLADGES